jgi:hypothetical protein
MFVAAGWFGPAVPVYPDYSSKDEKNGRPECMPPVFVLSGLSGQPA